MKLAYLPVFALVFSFFAIGAVSAQYATYANYGPSQQPILNAQLAYASCKSNFTISFLNAVIAVDSNSSATLSPQVSTVLSDITQLQSLAGSGNATNFNSYYESTFLPDLTQARSTLQSVIGGASFNASTEQSLNSTYYSLLTAYNTCAYQAATSYANARVTFYSEVISFLQNKTNVVSDQFQINASAADQLLQNATAQVVTPLQNGINQATNVSQISAALSSYCLFDGCSSGLNFHLDSRFYLLALSLIFAKAQSIPTAINSTAASEIQANLTSASSGISAAGSAVYTTDESQSIFGNLSNALSVLKSALLSFYNSISGQ